jgi:hypothetical protein
MFTKTLPKPWVYLPISLFFLSACNPSNFDPIEGVNVVTENTPMGTKTVLMSESFERDTLFVDPSLINPFGWRGFIWDNGNPVIGDRGFKVAALIMGDDIMGEAAHGKKALYFYGREGRSIHSIYLFTHSYDLSDFDEVSISFNYLLFGLNDSDDTTQEFLRLEVCANTPENCGVGSVPNHNKLNSSAWRTIFDADVQKNSLNGKNHLQTDWTKAEVGLDISQFETRDTFTFRFNAKMSDGFVSNDVTKALVDGAAIDMIEVVAGTKSSTPPPPRDDCDFVVPSDNPDSCHFFTIKYRH